MFKFLFKIILICILLFGFSHYANYLATGKAPDLDFKRSSLPDIDIPNITESISNKIESVKEKPKPIVKDSYLYKWRDDKGVIHYTSEKPTGDIKSLESIKISNDTNIVPAVSENNENHSGNNQENSQSQTPPSNMPANVYSAEGIKQLFDQAKNVQNLVNEQFTELENKSQ